MFLHIGRDRIVRTDDIIGIFDIETTSTSKISREYLAPGPKKEIISVTQELPKSFIVCAPGGKSRLKNGRNAQNTGHPVKIYISQISSGTLLKRLENARSPGDLLAEKGLAEL